VIGKEIEKPVSSAFAQVQDVEIFAPMDRSRMEEEARRLQKDFYLNFLGINDLLQIFYQH
jgi:hypothetical protein